MPQYQQVSGGACSLTMYPESSPGVVPASTKGVRLAFMSEGFKAGSSKKPRTVISGKRGAGKPYTGLPQMSGSLESASYVPQLGHLLRALCGAPTTTAETARTLDTKAVTQLGNGFVGIPCKGHGFVQDAVVTLVGTAKYDGSYRVEQGVTVDVISVSAPFQAETIAAGAKVYRGRVPFLEGDAKDLGGGLVGLPVKGGVHSLNAGESVTISGATAAYNGTHVLKDGTADGILAISKAFVAETFNGKPVAVPAYAKHLFKLPKRQPTVCIEKYLDFEDGAATEKYSTFGFCKVNGFSFNFGGDDELKFSLDFAVGRESVSATPIDANPVSLPAVTLDNIEASVWVAGVRRGEVLSGSVSNSFGIEAKAAVGDRGQYSRMPEGDPDCKATLSTFLETKELQGMVEAKSTVSFTLVLCGATGEQMNFSYPEAELDSEGAAITGKEGIMQDFSVLAFVDKSETVLTVELINRVASYA